MSTNYPKHVFGSSKPLALEAVNEGPGARPVYRTISYRAVAPLAMIFDALLIILTSVLSGIAYHHESISSTDDITLFIGYAAVVTALFVPLGKNYEVYTVSELLNLKSQIRKVTTIWVVVFLFLTAIAFVMKIGGNFSRGTVLSFFISGFGILIASRAAWRIYLADGMAVRRFSSRKIAVIVEQTSADDVEFINSLARHGLETAHRFILPGDYKNKKRRQDIIAQVISSVRGSNIEEILVGSRLDYWPDLSDLLSALRVLPLPVNLIPIGPLSEVFKLSSHAIGETVTIELQRGPRSLLDRFIKRTFDILLAAGALVLLVPLFLVTIIAIKLDSPGPIIFRQWRRGFNGIPFQILKFRTMSVLEDGENIVQARPNDNRVTRFGNWIRRTSVDELPQLINVLKGDMSIVGPRPHATAHDNEFDKIVSKYAYRHRVKPGLTGWAQVHGYRGQTRTIADIEQRIKLDLWYIDNWSLQLDIKILFMTIVEIVFGENAY